jgi:TolB-like protein/cytochrome c-type biogenesis protein CcmH/NrfG
MVRTVTFFIFISPFTQNSFGASKMVERTQKSVIIDLNQFKLHLHLKPDAEVTLHFDSPSRRFYLAVIGLIVHEMKKRGGISAIPLQHHLDVLALLNQTVGRAAGSSQKGPLLHRIYRKWKDALPDLENAPLFKVVGRKKRYDESMQKVYGFSEGEKDIWANLFEYRGSHENIRLKFAVDRLGAGLDDVSIIYGDSAEQTNEDAWQGFIENLNKVQTGKSVVAHVYQTSEASEPSSLKHGNWLSAMPNRGRLAAVIGLLVLVAGAGVFMASKLYIITPKPEVSSVQKKAIPMQDKPSIGVLPFVNMSGDPEQEYIADGLAENIITTLSKLHGLFVISRNSSFIYKGKPVKVQQVSKELGVRYVLEGSVQRSSDRVRVTAQLIDAIDGKHLWSERYDRDIKDIFELQDELTIKIVNSLRIKLLTGEEEKIRLKNWPSNLQYTEKLFEARHYLLQYNKEANIKAKQLYKEAIDLEPEYFGGYAGLAWSLFMDVHLGLSSSPRDSLNEAEKLCNKAIAIDESQDVPHYLLGHIYSMRRKFDRAIAECERAIALNPNSSVAYGFLGRTLVYAGRPEEAIDLCKKAARLNPLNLGRCNPPLAAAYRETDQYESAIDEHKKCIEYKPKNIFNHHALAATYALAGRYEEAQEAWSEVLKLDPKMTVEKLFPKRWPYGEKHRDRMIATMHKAGLK